MGNHTHRHVNCVNDLLDLFSSGLAFQMTVKNCECQQATTELSSGFRPTNQQLYLMKQHY
jgi:hypothetical protein